MRKWGISGSGALSVRWRTATDDLLDHWENIHDSAEPVPLEGHFTAVRETYQAVHSKRLVIVGQTGAGKTVLAHRLILDLLDTDGVTGPVPVLFSLSDWNPDSTDLQLWLIQQLVRDFGFLNDKNPATGETQAEILVKEKLILPVLDGFDEIPHQHHRAAIGKVSNIDYPLVVTSRPDEYREAAHVVKAVGRAAAIELQEVARDEAHRFLRLSTSKSRSREWDAVFEHLETQPDQTASQNLTRVLKTPLMVTLARTVYNDTPDRHPHDLLESQRFPTAAAVEDHLLDAYIDTVYTHRDPGPRGPRHPNWTPDQARHWLGYLATHLMHRTTHDLTWWQLPATLHRRTRILVLTAIFGLAAGLAFGLWVGLAYGLAAGLAYVGFGLAFGLAFGLGVGLINEVRFSRGRTGREPERLRLSLRRRGRDPRAGWITYLKKPTVEFTSGFAVGLSFGLSYVLAYGFAVGLSYGLSYGLTYGFAFGFAYGLPSVVVSALGDTYDPHATDRWTLLTRDRTVTLAQTIATTVLVGGFAYGFMVESFGMLRNLIFGLVLGSAFGIVRLALSAWGSWLLFARLWLPLTGRLPWRPKRFLEDAYDRGVLRTTGAVYQFRHARLRDHLADHYRSQSNLTGPPSARTARASVPVRASE
ncbi:NACHT domain-containing protein [Amycolatopsis taiwanensis]|uniref:NACHT domain-containing protein n=1 Tax=Amycolatopsis taiwanensis TaxID=342230 RepID=UPI00048343A9|nr:NACHT domain-containing protein [Amycolatopsis taiwanensis]